MGKKFTAPENLQDLDASALEAAVADAFAAYEAAKPKEGEDISDETLAELSAISDFVTAATAENATREQAAAARAEQLSAIEATMSSVTGSDEGTEGADGQDEAEGTVEAAGNPFPPKKVLPEDVADGGADDDEEDENGKKKPVMSAKPVQRPANLNRSFAARAAGNAPAAKTPERRTPASSLVAAANVGGYEPGQKFDSFADAADLITKRLSALPTNAPAGTVSRNSALVINLPENEFNTNNPEFKGKDSSEMLMAAGNEARLKGGSLVAAGGWGAPSERSLDFCVLESAEGLISLPEVTAHRGGLEYTKGPVFADVLASSTGFWDMTEAVADAGSELKTSLRPSIPTFTNVRLDAVGVMMEAGLLLRQGWPELVDRYAKLLMTAHQYKLAMKTITQIQAYTGAATPIANAFGNALDILHILEMLAIGERQRNAMSPSQTLEALVPFWVKAVIRADLAQRTGVDTISVSDAQIDGYFTARGIKVQWLNAYQNLAIDPTTKQAKEYPSTVEVIFYVAGSFVNAVSPVITLDTIYDSTNLKKNDYVHLFVEQGTAVTNPCGTGQRISFPLYANGRRAGFTDNATGMNDNLFKAPVA